MKNTQSRIRVGIVGAGYVARFRHLPGLKRRDDVEIAVVCDQHAETAASAANEFGVGETSTDWRAVVNRPDLDAICIATPPYLHAAVSIASLAAGKHVFCQARMAMNLAEAREMLAAVRRIPGKSPCSARLPTA